VVSRRPNVAQLGRTLSGPRWLQRSCGFSGAAVGVCASMMVVVAAAAAVVLLLVVVEVAVEVLELACAMLVDWSVLREEGVVFWVLHGCVAALGRVRFEV
jgi:hypothetical protein